MKCLVLNYCALVKHSLEQVGNMREERVSHGFIFVYILGSKYYWEFMLFFASSECVRRCFAARLSCKPETQNLCCLLQLVMTVAQRVQLNA